MRLPVPSPADVVSSAVAARDAVQTALALVPRAVEAMSRVEALLSRAEAAVTRVETVAASAEEAATRARRTLDVVEVTARDAGRAVDGVSGLLDRVDGQLTTWEKPLRALAPAAQRFADTLHPDEVEAAIALVDRMPAVLDHLENDVLPMMRQLDRVGPDLHEILEIVEDLRRVVTGLPGVGLLRRRGNDEPPEVESSVHGHDSNT